MGLVWAVVLKLGINVFNQEPKPHQSNLILSVFIA